MVGLGVAVGSLKGRRETVMVAPCDMCDLADEHVVFRRFVGILCWAIVAFVAGYFWGSVIWEFARRGSPVFDWYKKFEYHKS